VGGGRKSKLGDDSGKLFFILFYYRHYPTLRLAQVLFDLEDFKSLWLGALLILGFI